MRDRLLLNSPQGVLFFSIALVCEVSQAMAVLFLHRTGLAGDGTGVARAGSVVSNVLAECRALPTSFR